MLYNKNQFKEVANKKTLHKVKKHWVTVTIAMLGLISSGAVTATNASAKVNGQKNSHSDRDNHQLSTDQIHDQQPELVTGNVHKQSDDSMVKNHEKRDMTDYINKETNHLHNNIVKRIIGRTPSESKSDDNFRSLGTVSDKNASASSNADNSSRRPESTAVVHSNATLHSSRANQLFSSASASQSTSQSLSASSSARASFARVMHSDANVINSYNQENGSYANQVLNDLGSLSTSNPILLYAKHNASAYYQKFMSFASKENQVASDLNHQVSNSDAASNTSLITMANSNIAKAGSIDSKARSIISTYIEPLEAQSMKSTESTAPSSSAPAISNSSASSSSVSSSASTSNSVISSESTAGSLSKARSESISDSKAVSSYYTSVAESDRLRHNSASSSLNEPVTSVALDEHRGNRNSSAIEGPSKVTTNQSKSTEVFKRGSHKAVKALRSNIDHQSDNLRSSSSQTTGLQNKPLAKSAASTARTSDSLTDHRHEALTDEQPTSNTTTSKPHKDTDASPVDGNSNPDPNSENDAQDTRTNVSDNDQFSGDSTNHENHSNSGTQSASDPVNSTKLGGVNTDVGKGVKSTTSNYNSLGTANEDNSKQYGDSSKLPQTNEVLVHGKTLTEILSSVMGATFALSAYVDKHRE